MEIIQKFTQQLSVAVRTNLEQLQQDLSVDFKQVLFKKLRGGFLFVLGYLLSPLCWWNDLLFNLPIAYFFGYMCSLVAPRLFLPCAIAGYWLSNIIGILMMQAGVVDVLQNQPEERDLKKELFNGFVSSTIYTLVILALIQFKIIDSPILSNLTGS
jgi:Zn-dependent protease with chaperone function